MILAEGTRAFKWKKIALEAYRDDENVSGDQVMDVMALFLISRFKQLSLRRIRAMMDFDLSETKAGEELIEIGEKRGEKRGKIE